MAIFVAASDERYSNGYHRNAFFYGGFLAPSSDWSEMFKEEWEKNVLEGPPRIPWLHMTEIRRPEWCEKYEITRSQGDRRVKAAFELIADTPSLTPIGTDLNAGHLLDTFKKKIRVRSGARKDFRPDYLAFLAYAYSVLMFCSRTRPDAERVDFLVERNSEITNHIQEFYEDLPTALASVKLEWLIPLLGTLIPGGKDSVPLQAADVLCWYSQRFREGTLDDKNIRRYKVIALRKGARVQLTNRDITSLWSTVVGDSEDQN